MDAQPNLERDDAGFTLIELLIVVVILGVLATVVVFAVGGIVDRGEVSALASDAKTIETAEESHFAIHGSYAEEATLVSAGFMRAESELHDIALAPDGRSYAVADAGSLPATTTPATTTPATTTPATTTPATTTPATTAAPTTLPAVPTGWAGFSGQATGAGSRTLVIIGNGGSSTQDLYTMLTTNPLPDTTVIWLDGNDVNDTDDVLTIINAAPTYMVAADSVPIARTFSPFGTTFVGQYMDAIRSSPADFWWTHQDGNPTRAQLLSHLP